MKRMQKHSHSNGEMFSHVEIKAKRSGTVIARNIELGEEAESNKTIFTIADLDSVYADLQASSKDLSSLKEGQKVTIVSDEEDKTIGDPRRRPDSVPRKNIHGTVRAQKRYRYENPRSADITEYQP